MQQSRAKSWRSTRRLTPPQAPFPPQRPRDPRPSCPACHNARSVSFRSQGLSRGGRQRRVQGHQRRGRGAACGWGAGTSRAASRSASARQRSRSTSAARVRSSAARTEAARSSSRSSSCVMVARATANSKAVSSWATEGATVWASGGQCPLGAHWASAHRSRSSAIMFQRFRLSRRAGRFPASTARMMVRRLTLARAAASLGDRAGRVGAPTGRAVGRVGVTATGGGVWPVPPASRSRQSRHWRRCGQSFEAWPSDGSGTPD